MLLLQINIVIGLSVLKLKQATSSQLINALRGYFTTFGVPEILSSDGARPAFYIRDWDREESVSQDKTETKTERALVSKVTRDLTKGLSWLLNMQKV